MLTVEDVLEFEKKYGKIADKALVLMKTGWSKKVKNHAEYTGTKDGVSHFPGFGPDVANFLLKERSIVGIGIDTASLDIGATS
mmetsp:Transcript_113809/g.170231  ORF Transcript_113809/g.170231 Transcript_113809/m.170231 type:complete len:83 (+) Transcript_113809:410-658(+)